MSSQPARRRLPSNPSAEHLRKQAKRLARDEELALSEAQRTLAAAYGARDWAELMRMVETMRRGASEHAPRNQFEPLPAAANAGDLARVRDILANGSFTQHDLDLALARAVLNFGQRERIARLLAEHGADPDGQYGADYGPIVFAACECLDVDGLRFLIEAGADVRFAPVATKYGAQCPLSHWLGTYLRGRNAAKREGIDLLLTHSAHVPAEVTPELLAIHRDDAAALGARLDAAPELATRTFDSLPYFDCPGPTLLHYACEFGAGACIELLLARGSAPNARAGDGQTPLHRAVRGCDEATVRTLLDHGAAQWIDDDRGRRPEHCLPDRAINPACDAIARLLTRVHFGEEGLEQAVAAIDAGDVEGLARLLGEQKGLATARAAGGDAITRGYFRRPTLLHFVACNPARGPHMPARIVESTRAILDAGAEVDATTADDPQGTTLALVASSGAAHTDALAQPLLELLVSRGADPKLGLAAALLHRFVDTAALLLRLGARHTLLSAAALGAPTELAALLPIASDDEKLRAAWAAAINGQAASLAALLEAGVPVNARLPRPFAPTLLHEAAWHGHTQSARTLLAFGADRTIRDAQFDATPASWARHNGNAETADLCEPDA